MNVIVVGWFIISVFSTAFLIAVTHLGRVALKERTKWLKQRERAASYEQARIERQTEWPPLAWHCAVCDHWYGSTTGVSLYFEWEGYWSVVLGCKKERCATNVANQITNVYPPSAMATLANTTIQMKLLPKCGVCGHNLRSGKSLCIHWYQYGNGWQKFISKTFHYEKKPSGL